MTDKFEMTRPSTAETIRQAEIAMGSSSRIMTEFRFQKRLGWLASPETIELLAGRNPIVKGLIWC